MPTTVFVNDYNTEVTFPDGVSQSEMQSALAKQFPAKGKAAPAPTEKPGLLKRAIDKVTDIVGGASMGESEQFKQMAEGGLQGISDFSNFLDSPQEPAKDTKDFLTRTVPVSALRLVKGTVQMPGQIVKGIAQTASDLERSASYADVKGAINPALLDVIQNKPRDPGLGDLGKGMIDFIAGATGLYNQETGKWATGYEEWGYNYINNLMNDPVGTMAVLYPAGVKGGKVFNKVQFTKTVAKEMAKSSLDKQTASLKVLVNKYPTYIKNVKPGAVPYEKLTHLENVLERQDARLVAEEQARLDAIKQSAKEIRAGDVKPQSPAPVTETILTPKEAASIATKEAIEIVPNELGRVVEGFFKNPDVLIENKTKNARRTSSEILRGFEEKGKGEIVKEPTKAEILEEHKQIVEAEKAKEAPANTEPIAASAPVKTKKAPNPKAKTKPVKEEVKPVETKPVVEKKPVIEDEPVFTEPAAKPAQLDHMTFKEFVEDNGFKWGSLEYKGAYKKLYDSYQEYKKNPAKGKTEKPVEKSVIDTLEEQRKAETAAVEKANSTAPATEKWYPGFKDFTTKDLASVPHKEHPVIAEAIKKVEGKVRAYDDYLNEDGIFNSHTANAKASAITKAKQELARKIEEVQKQNKTEAPTPAEPVKKPIQKERLAESAKDLRKKITELGDNGVVTDKGVLYPKVRVFTVGDFEVTSKGVSIIENNKGVQTRRTPTKAELSALDRAIETDTAQVVVESKWGSSGSARKKSETIEVLHDPSGATWGKKANTEAKPVEVKAPAPESKPSNGNGKPAWQMTRKEYMKENPYSSAASHQFKIREAILAGENVPKNILKEYPELAKVAYEVNYGKIDRGSFSWKKKGEIEPDFSHITDPELREQVEAVERMYQNTDNAIAARTKKSWNDVRDWVTKHVLDVRGNAKRTLVKDAGELGREAAMNSDLISGSSGKAGVMTEAAHKKIFADLTIGEHGVLKRIIQSKRTIEIDSYKQGMKHSEGLTGLDHQAYLNEIQKAFKLTDEQMKKLSKKADEYFGEMKTQLDELRQRGMITQEAYDALSKHKYSPRQFLDKIDPEFEMTIGGKRVNVTESGIKALEKGDYGLMENNPEKLLSQVIARTQSRIFRNEANKSLHTIALSDEAMKAIAEGKAVDFTDFAQKYGVNAEQAGKLRSVNTNGLVQIRPFKDSVQLSTFIDGQKHTFHVYKDLAKDWVVNDPLVNSQFANILQWISGAKVVKAVATGYNPAFVITNMPRDIGLIWSSTKEYSSHLPVAFGEMVSDLVKVAPDVIKRTGRVKNFVNEGGQMTFLTHYGKFRGQGHLIEKVNSLGNLLAWAGETSELWTRIALRERAIKNGASPVEATHIARNYLDFSQGGNMVKAIDNVVPYFNASVQGTRSLLRGAAKDPKVFTYKMAQLGTLATGLYLANQINKECWDSISDRDKEANFIITTPWKYTDDQGQERHLYFKIAKDQGQRAFTSLFEGIMQIAVEKKVPTEQMMMAIGDLFPVPGLPPTVKALVAYLTNRDMWNFEEIWKGQEGIDPKEEYHDKTTNPAFITAGKVTGMSPARMENAVGNITPYNNPFVNLVGGGVKTLFGSLPEEVQSKSVIQMMTENGSIRRFLSATNPYTQHREDMEEGTMKGKTENFKNNREFDRLYNEYIKAGRDPKIGDKIDNWLNTLPEYEADRLSNRADMIDAVDKLPDRTWWKKLAQVQQPEARAEIFYKRWAKASQEERARLEESLENIPGIASERFYDKSDELVAKGGR